MYKNFNYQKTIIKNTKKDSEKKYAILILRDIDTVLGSFNTENN